MKYTIDVPVTLSVTVEGPKLTAQSAKDISRKFADGVDLDYAEMVSFNYTNQLTDSAHPRIISAALEFSSEESCEVLDAES